MAADDRRKRDIDIVSISVLDGVRRPWRRRTTKSMLKFSVPRCEPGLIYPSDPFSRHIWAVSAHWSHATLNAVHCRGAWTC